jgi:hypothetical protein
MTFAAYLNDPDSHVRRVMKMCYPDTPESPVTVIYDPLIPLPDAEA